MKIAVIIYLVGFVLTFGFTAAEKDRELERPPCDTQEHRASAGFPMGCYNISELEGTARAMIWPAYWTLRASRAAFGGLYD